VGVVYKAGAPGDRQREVGARADESHGLRRVEPLRVAAHPLAFGLPVQEASAEDEVGVVRQRHPRILCE
jgi:hypothetical protein